MIRVIDFAVICQHVYTPEKELFNNPKSKFIVLPNAKMSSNYDGWYKLADFDKAMQPEGAIYAGFYLHFIRGKLRDCVVAVRGTDNAANDMVDLQSWFDDVLGPGRQSSLPIYLAQVMRFYHRCHDWLRHVGLPPMRPSITGHSLGGALAQLFNLCFLPTIAVSFNSPGCGNMPGIHVDRADLVHEFSARWGVINRIGKPVNKPIWIDVPEEATVAQALVEDWSQTLSDAGTGLEHSGMTVSHEGNAALDTGAVAAEWLGGELKAIDIEQAALRVGGNIPAAAAILAQHKIGNMVHALQMPANDAIANQAVAY